MNWLALALASLIVFALSAYLLARLIASHTGLPSGKIIYSDTGFPVGKLGHVATNETEEKQEKPLLSKRYGLIGRPDYLIQTSKGIIPVEVKSARLPSSGRPYNSHVMQLAAYCLLVEDVLRADVPYGILCYRDREVRIDYTAELREELLDIIDEMREARRFDEVHRDHEDARRCANCYMREVCDEAL
jgi:CRISPR-associated exonuclease Cas4